MANIIAAAAIPARIEPTRITSTPRRVGPEAGLIMMVSVPAQISKLTILAMMKAPMLIQQRPPSPVTISRSSMKNAPA